MEGRGEGLTKGDVGNPLDKQTQLLEAGGCVEPKEMWDRVLVECSSPTPTKVTSYGLLITTWGKQFTLKSINTTK